MRQNLTGLNPVKDSGLMVVVKLNPYEGIFLAIEGLDGSGSNKLARELVSDFTKLGYSVVYVKEPSTSRIGRLIKEIVTDRGGKLSPLSLQFMFAADRALQWEERVEPALKDGKLVITDRYFWSAVAYQSLYYPTSKLLEINSEFILPDFTFFIDVPPEECAKNLDSNLDEVSIYKSAEELSHVRDTYEWLAIKFAYRFSVTRGETSEKRKEEIMREVCECLQTKKGVTAGRRLLDKLRKRSEN